MEKTDAWRLKQPTGTKTALVWGKDKKIDWDEAGKGNQEYLDGDRCYP